MKKNKFARMKTKLKKIIIKKLTILIRRHFNKCWRHSNLSWFWFFFVNHRLIKQMWLTRKIMLTRCGDDFHYNKNFRLWAWKLIITKLNYGINSYSIHFHLLFGIFEFKYLFSKYHKKIVKYFYKNRFLMCVINDLK